MKRFFKKLLSILRITGKIAETAGPAVIGIANPAIGSLAEVGVQVLEKETKQSVIPPIPMVTNNSANPKPKSTP